MQDTWLSIEEPAEGLYKEKGSKFISYVFPVEGEEAAEKHLEVLKKKHWDSRHVCFAWRFGREGERARAYDGGEPAHSAGDPILNELRSRELTEILAVVVRYFGGTKLGIAGLIEAYKAATADALDQAKVVEKTATIPLIIRYPYTMTAEVNKRLHHLDLKPSESEYGADCRQVIEIRESRFEQAEKAFHELGIIEKAD